jgi:hypothetical protein
MFTPSTPSRQPIVHAHKVTDREDPGPLIDAYPEQIALVARDETVCRPGSGQRQQIIVERIAGNRDDLKVRDNESLCRAIR